MALNARQGFKEADAHSILFSGFAQYCNQYVGAVESGLWVTPAASVGVI